MFGFIRRPVVVPCCVTQHSGGTSTIQIDEKAPVECLDCESARRSLSLMARIASIGGGCVIVEQRDERKDGAE